MTKNFTKGQKQDDANGRGRRPLPAGVNVRLPGEKGILVLAAD
eukprot:gene48602-6377_t